MSAIERSRSQLALDPRTRFLPPMPRRGYVVGAEESLAEALHRLTTEQFTIAIDALSDPQADLGIATTATLRSVRRIAAVLRLVRRVIGQDSYRTELAVLESTDELLSGLEAGKPELRALDHVRARYDLVLRPTAFLELRNQLLQRHQLRRLQALSEGESIQRTLHSLRRARARFAAWPTTHDDAGTYDRDPIDDSFASLADGLERTYRRGRKRWRSVVDGDPTVLEDWHGECRHLGHQLEVLRSSWPEVIGATAEAAAQLERVLAEAEGMGALQAVVRNDDGLFLDPEERALLDALVSHGHRELVAVAATLGSRIYAEPTKQFMRRMGAYWESRGFDVPTAS